MPSISTPRLLTVVIAFTVCATLKADGLIYRLPPDGAWVRYRYSEEGKFTLPAANDAERGNEEATKLPLKSIGAVRLSSVGQVMEQGERCRWIELKFEVDISGKVPDPRTGELVEKKESRRITLKLLIPEKELTTGADPLTHVRRLYFIDGDKPVELVEDERAKQYEIDRIRPIFPKPPGKDAAVEKRAVEVLETGAGKFVCERLSFDSDYEGPLTGGRRGWWSWRGRHDVWLNDEVPFGVAALKLAVVSDEWPGERDRSPKGTVESIKYLVVSEVGEGATTALPDSK